MSDTDINKAIFDRIRDGAEQILDDRKNRPDFAAAQQPGQLENWRRWENTKDPVERAAIIREFVQVQLDLGIPFDKARPIPDFLTDMYEGRRQPMIEVIGKKLSRIPEIAEGASSAERIEMFKQFDGLYASYLGLFGDQTDEVITYALERSRGVGKNVARQLTETISSTLGPGRKPQGDVARGMPLMMQRWNAQEKRAQAQDKDDEAAFSEGRSVFDYLSDAPGMLMKPWLPQMIEGASSRFGGGGESSQQQAQPAPPQGDFMSEYKSYLALKEVDPEGAATQETLNSIQERFPKELGDMLSRSSQ